MFGHSLSFQNKNRNKKNKEELYKGIRINKIAKARGKRFQLLKDLKLKSFFSVSVGKICIHNREILGGFSSGNFSLKLSFTKLVPPGFARALPLDPSYGCIYSCLPMSARHGLPPSEPRVEFRPASFHGGIIFPVHTLITTLCALKESGQTDCFTARSAKPLTTHEALEYNFSKPRFPDWENREVRFAVRKSDLRRVQSLTVKVTSLLPAPSPGPVS